MKANDYVMKYKPQIDSATTLQEIINIVGPMMVEFIDESVAVGTKRAGNKPPNDRIMIPVVREFNLKWRAICVKIPQLKPDAYINFFRDKGVYI